MPDLGRGHQFEHGVDHAQSGAQDRHEADANAQLVGVDALQRRVDLDRPDLHIRQRLVAEPKKFREVVRELSWLLGYEALADVEVRPIEVNTPMECIDAHELGVRIGLVPILRAGLGMVDAMLELMPTAEVWHLGLFRDERTLRPVEYYNKLPDSASVDLCLILDPMLATGGSATAAIEVLKRWGATRIKLVNLIVAPEGVDAVTSAHPDVE